jgi:hypothetical protein
MDCYEPSDISYHSVQAIPQLDDEPVNSKLAYRYFIKGRHAFSAGDLNRATLMFQCALDANPADSKIRAFLKRASELKALSADDSDVNRFRPQTTTNDNPLSYVNFEDDLATANSISRLDKSSSFEGLFPSLISPASETIDMAPLLKHRFPERTTSYRNDNALVVNSGNKNIIKGNFSSSSDVFMNAKVETARIEGASTPLWETIPSSPAELLDSAPSGESWNDFLATFAAIGGVVLFGLVLTM